MRGFADPARGQSTHSQDDLADAALLRASLTRRARGVVALALSALLTLAYWIWAAFIAVGAGIFGAALNTCDEGCRDDFPPLVEPWAWGEYDAFPEVTFIAFAGLVAVCAFALFMYQRRFVPASLALLCSFALLSYPFFAGLTDEGRATLAFGPALGVVALAALVVRSLQDQFTARITK
jgi:hypothetical protein